MKKLMSLVVGGLFVASMAFANHISINPSVGFNSYDELESSASVGVGVQFSQLGVKYVPSEVEVGVGFNYANPQSYLGKDLDVFSFPLTLGYKYQVTPEVTITPFVGIDFIVSNDDEFDTTIGTLIGAKAAYDVNEKWSVELSGGYEVANLQVGEDKLSANGFRGQVAGVYKFS